MPLVPLTLAISDYEHVRDITSGRIPVKGVALTCLELPVEEIFHRFSQYREWEVSEISLAKYVSLRASGDQMLTAIPVFPSRVFRHSAFYVRREGGICDVRDLAGRRIGIPEWAQTAGVYARALLAHEYGVSLNDIDWYQAGVNQPGRQEHVALDLKGFSVQPMPTRTLNEMLVAGDLDALISARPPLAAGAGGPITRLFPDWRSRDTDYFRRTGIFPIMHTIALRRDVLAHFPWLARNLLSAFEVAKDRSLARMTDVTQSRWPIQWGCGPLQIGDDTSSGDTWPYGVDSNRTTLDAFLSYAAEQGVAARRLTPEDLFAPESLTEYRV